MLTHGLPERTDDKVVEAEGRVVPVQSEALALGET